MGELRNALKKERRDLAEQLDRIYGEALEIWSEPHLRKLTEHGKDHIDQVLSNLDVLTGPLQRSSDPLSPEEIFVLLAACYLHDVGMQLDQPDAREQHAQYTFELILHARDSTARELHVRLSLDDRNARQAVALVARGHWTEHALALPERDALWGNVEGRLRLLGVLLATADLLDLSPVRARYFRGDHRLLRLDPMARLHHTLHEQVKSFKIEPADPSIADELCFVLRWQDDHQEVRELAEWTLHWFNSQWHQLAPALHRESGGRIRWARPWARAIFQPALGPTPRLSPASRAILTAERAEQGRLDCDAFAEAVASALDGEQLRVLVLPEESSGEGPRLGEWALALARTRPPRVAQVDVGLETAGDLASAIDELLEQWGEPLEEASREAATAALRSAVESGEQGFVVLISAGMEELLAELLGELLRCAAGSRGVRLVIVLSPLGFVPEVPAGVPVEHFARRPITRRDLRRHLEATWGLRPEDSEALVSEAEGYGFLAQPGHLHTFVRKRCRAWECR